MYQMTIYVMTVHVVMKNVSMYTGLYIVSFRLQLPNLLPEPTLIT